MMIKVLELFGGIGAIRKALERENIDFKTIDYVEIDKNAVKSYNSLYNENFKPKSVIDYRCNQEVNLLMHGSPCVSFSVIGKQDGGAKNSGTESSLLWETVRILKEMKDKPKVVIWENVPSILYKKHRPVFNEYLKEMAEMGYSNSYTVLNARDFGIPQDRNRCFTISIIGKNFEFNNLKHASMRNVKDFLETDINYEKHKISDRTRKIQRGELTDSAMNGKNMIIDKWFNTILAKATSVPACSIIDMGNGRLRHVTELECWRAMGFDDEDFYKCKAIFPTRYRKGKECRCNILYRQAGNSIVVPILQSIVKELKKMLENNRDDKYTERN